jgi:hypothetical protein
MSAFDALLSVDGGVSDVKVIHCSYALNRDVDASGKPSGAVRGGLINIQIESTKDVSLNEWMVEQFTAKNGKVTFKNIDANTSMKELTWENGYVVQLNESFDIVGENSMTISFTVSAEKIKIGSASHDNRWPKH